MNFLRRRDILVDKHRSIIIVEIPVLGTDRVKPGIGSLDIAVDVASDFAGFESMTHHRLPYGPI